MSVVNLPSLNKLQPIFMVTGMAFTFAMSACTPTTARSQSTAASNEVSAQRVPEQLKPDLYPDGAKATPEPVVEYGRYTLVSTDPRADQKDLMSQIVDVNIPDTLNPNVQDSMSYVLKRSGYMLCPGTGDINVLYTRPLPASQYHLGPMTLRNTLQVLAGPAWQVEVDEITRGVCFNQRPGYRHPASVQSIHLPPPQNTTPVAQTFPVPVTAPVLQGVH